MTGFDSLVPDRAGWPVIQKLCGAMGEERAALHGLARDGLLWTLSATQEQ